MNPHQPEDNIEKSATKLVQTEVLRSPPSNQSSLNSLVKRGEISPTLYSTLNNLVSAPERQWTHYLAADLFARRRSEAEQLVVEMLGFSEYSLQGMKAIEESCQPNQGPLANVLGELRALKALNRAVLEVSDPFAAHDSQIAIARSALNTSAAFLDQLENQLCLSLEITGSRRWGKVFLGEDDLMFVEAGIEKERLARECYFQQRYRDLEN